MWPVCGPSLPCHRAGVILRSRPRLPPPDAGRAGLGLSIAQRLAEIQGGRVEYQPRPGGGSMFLLGLPAAEIEPALD